MTTDRHGFGETKRYADFMVALDKQHTVSVTCKRGHTTHGSVNYCPVCGTKFFRCTCGEYICFDKQHAHIAFVNPDRVEVGNWMSVASRRLRSWFSQ